MLQKLGVGYSFGFNGKEKDDEMKGNGNSHDYGLRIYDPRIAKFLSVDPIARDYPCLSPYNYTANNPVYLKDIKGDKITIFYIDENGKERRFRYKPGVKVPENEFIQKTVQAIEHLRQHQSNDGPSARDVIDHLASSRKMELFIRKTDFVENINFTPTTRDKPDGKMELLNTGTIYFNPNIGLAIVDNNGQKTGGKISPATVLVHEIDHASAYFSDPLAYLKNVNKKLFNQYDSKEEKRAVKGLERAVASYFGEGIRKNHRGQAIYTTETTGTQEVTIPQLNPGGKQIELDPTKSIF